MPFISRLFLKTGVIYLILSMMLFLAIQIPGSGFSRVWLPVFYHMLMVGWVTQIIFGVAIWMFPGIPVTRTDRRGPGSKAPDTGKKLPTKGSLPVHYTVYVLLNVGLLLRWMFEPIVDGGLAATGLSVPPGHPLHTAAALFLPLSGLLQVLAFGGFAWQIWPRVRGKRNA